MYISNVNGYVNVCRKEEKRMDDKQLTERLEIRLSKKDKQSAKAISKRYEMSLAEVFRRGLLLMKEEWR